jgi:hypothetical protein
MCSLLALFPCDPQICGMSTAVVACLSHSQGGLRSWFGIGAPPTDVRVTQQLCRQMQER